MGYLNMPKNPHYPDFKILDAEEKIIYALLGRFTWKTTSERNQVICGTALLLGLTRSSAYWTVATFSGETDRLQSGPT